MEDGIIELDTDRGKTLGFTSDKFDGYLWKTGNYIIISNIESLNQGQGNLSKLFSSIQKIDMGIKVPTPFARMKAIIIEKGFKRKDEFFEEANEMCEVWVK